MKTKVHHVIGTTQWLGTCKMHLFVDCPQLTKKRVRQMAWGVSDSTGAIYTEEYEDISDRRTCKICLKRRDSLKAELQAFSAKFQSDQPPKALSDPQRGL